MHLIKKYANRKMYDTHDKRYISMDQLSALIKKGEEVSIIDNKTGDDITNAVVSQLIGRDNPEKESAVSPQLLMQLLRKGGGTLTDYAKKYVSVWQGAFNMAEDEVSALVNRLVKNKELSLAEAGKLKNEILAYTGSLKKWIGETIDKQVGEVMQAMNLATNDQLETLSKKVETLAKKVAKLEKDRPKPRAKPKTKAATKTTLRRKSTAKTKKPS